ncbi:hypothetical protein V2W45_1389829 [Cenococcum geophilum]
MQPCIPLIQPRDSHLPIMLSNLVITPFIVLTMLIPSTLPQPRPPPGLLSSSHLEKLAWATQSLSTGAPTPSTSGS